MDSELISESAASTTAAAFRDFGNVVTVTFVDTGDVFTGEVVDIAANGNATIDCGSFDVIIRSWEAVKAHRVYPPRRTSTVQTMRSSASSVAN